MNFDYADNYREVMRMIKESETLSPKEYGMLLQKRRNKKKRKGGRQ